MLLAALAGAGACEREVPAASLGERWFRDPDLSTSPFNTASCATCHAAEPGAPPWLSARLDAGPNLAGAAARPSWWGGSHVRLLDAMNACMDNFMGGVLEATGERARQLYAYLDETSPAAAEPPVSFTIVRDVTALEGLVGDAARGAGTYRGACRRCHGDAHTGAGRPGPLPSVIPGDTLRVFPSNARAVVVEKIRHGRFFGIGGIMPLYAREALDDAQIADLLAYLGL